MRSSLLALIPFLGVPMTLPAATYLYVSMVPEQKIQIYRLDPKDGGLSIVDSLSVDGAPGCLAVDSQKKHLFASLRTTSRLASFAIDTATGKLKAIGAVDLPKGENAAYVKVDRTGRLLISASYAAGKIVVHRVGEDGVIKSPPTQTLETAKTAHCVGIDAGNRWAFVPHVEPNAVYQYRMDLIEGKLKDAGKAAGGVEKAGPRHIAFHPSQKFAFTSNEKNSTITAYAFDSETGLKPLQTLSTLPADFKGQNTTAEVKVHPSGKFVWVSNRGHDSLAGFSIDEASGKLTSIGQTATEQTPRSFEFEPDGQYAFGAGEGNGKLAVFKVDAGTGKLTRINTIEVGKSLTWIMAVKQ